MTAVVDQLPELDSDYAVSPDQVSQYQRDGHAILRNAASREETKAYKPVIGRVMKEQNQEDQDLKDRDTYHKAFLQTGNLWEINEGVKKFVMARRFAKVAADLMGVDGVRLWHDQALFKEAGGGHTPWHQDQYYWPLDTDNTITMWMPLTDAPIETGTLTFASGSHREGALAQMGISDQSSEFFRKLCIEKGFPLYTAELAPGDATFHSGWVLHKAPGNSAWYTREAMTIIYYEDGAKVAQPQNEHQPVDMERWLPGLKPGDVAASPLNPLLYHRDWDKS